MEPYTKKINKYKLNLNYAKYKNKKILNSENASEFHKQLQRNSK